MTYGSLKLSSHLSPVKNTTTIMAVFAIMRPLMKRQVLDLFYTTDVVVAKLVAVLWIIQITILQLSSWVYFNFMIPMFHIFTSHHTRVIAMPGSIITLQATCHRERNEAEGR